MTCLAKSRKSKFINTLILIDINAGVLFNMLSLFCMRYDMSLIFIFILGLFIGGNIGILAASLCYISKKSRLLG